MPNIIDEIEYEKENTGKKQAHEFSYMLFSYALEKK
jgi:hypothetical protein